jgi:hypothetical protein
MASSCSKCSQNRALCYIILLCFYTLMKWLCSPPRWRFWCRCCSAWIIW